MNKINLKIKKGDTVKVLTGKDRNKTGKVLSVMPKDSRLIVEGVNIHTRFSRPKKTGEKGQKMQFPGSFSIAKVMLICPSCGKPTRTGSTVTKDGNLRKCVKCGKNI